MKEPLPSSKFTSLLFPTFVLILGDQSDFYFLNQGDSPYIDGINDEETFEDTRNALSMLGFSEIEQNDMFQILAAVLHLGNIRFVECIISSDNEQDQEGCTIQVSYFVNETNCFYNSLCYLYRLM